MHLLLEECCKISCQNKETTPRRFKIETGAAKRLIENVLGIQPIEKNQRKKKQSPR